MKTYVPDYYPKFACIAGRCRHSCCEGWGIDIDEESLARFRQAQGEIGQRLRDNIAEDEEGAHFILKEGDRCPFLREDNLCDLILALGEDCLCQICADHPRFRNFFADRTEMGLGMCCEEATRLILGRDEPMQLIEWEDDGFDDESDETDNEIIALRDAFVKIVQDRSMSVSARVEELLRRTGATMPERDMPQWAQFFMKLERMDEKWAERLASLKNAPVTDAQEIPETAKEQLLVYYLLRHIPHAAQDGDMQGRLLLCILLWQLVLEMYARIGGGMAQLCDIARMCSSEIEYSDENLQETLDELAFLA